MKLFTIVLALGGAALATGYGVQRWGGDDETALSGINEMLYTVRRGDLNVTLKEILRACSARSRSISAGMRFMIS